MVTAPMHHFIAERARAVLYNATLGVDVTELRSIVPQLIIVLFIATITRRVTTSIYSAVNIVMSLLWQTKRECIPPSICLQIPIHLSLVMETDRAAQWILK